MNRFLAARAADRRTQDHPAQPGVGSALTCPWPGGFSTWWRPLRNPKLVARKTLTPGSSPGHGSDPLPAGRGRKSRPAIEVEAGLRKGLLVAIMDWHSR